jgi:invasion protein IalB
MITMRAFKSAAPLALAALLALFTAAAAQQTDPPAKPAKETKDTKEPKAKKKPAAKKKTDENKDAKETKDVVKEVKEKEKKPAKAPPAPGGGQPTLLGQFGDWGAYTATSGSRKVCYALAKPASTATEPAGRPRDPVYVFVSTRPAENVHNEVSIVQGYPFKPGSEAAVDLGAAKYAMYTQADGAWIKNAAEEARMVEAMRKTPEMIITGESGKGTKSTDKYSLKGLSQALDRVGQECK